MPLKKRKIATHANATLVHSIPANFRSTRAVSPAPAARWDPRLDSDRQAVDRALDHGPGAGGADLDRIGGRTTRAVAARLLAADLGADPVRAAGRVLRAAVVVIPDAVAGMAGPVAAPIRTRRSPTGRRALAVAGRGVADHLAGDRHSRQIGRAH